MSAQKIKVAIVHDWLIGGGAEKVVYQLHKLFPEAPIYTSYCTVEWQKKLSKTKVVTSYMQAWPFSKLRKFLPVLRQKWFENIDFSGFDLVISSSGAEAKGIRVPKGTVHINYAHAPTHYYWARYDDYIKHPGFGVFNPIARFGLKLLINPLRKWDYKAAQRPDYIIANSTFTSQQLKKYYGRDADVIHPPVNIDRFKPTRESERHGLVIAGRQVAYKKFDIAVQACTELKLALTVIGDGPEHKKLVKLGGPSIDFVGHAPDARVVELFQTAEAFIFPGVDDFGIVAVEAIAAGTPVIAFKDGGALDYVIEGKTGLLFEEQTSRSLRQVLRELPSKQFENEKITESADRFSESVFDDNIKRFINKVLEK